MTPCIKVSLRRVASNGTGDKRHNTPPVTVCFSLLPIPSLSLESASLRVLLKKAVSFSSCVSYCYSKRYDFQFCKLLIQKLVGVWRHVKISQEACCHRVEEGWHCLASHSIYAGHASQPQSTDSADSPFSHARLAIYFKSGSAPTPTDRPVTAVTTAEDPPCQPAARRHVSSAAGPPSGALTRSGFESCIAAVDSGGGGQQRVQAKGNYKSGKEGRRGSTSRQWPDWLACYRSCII